MTTSSSPAAPGGLVLLGHGPADQVRALVLQAGPLLAAALALPWAGLLDPSEPPSALDRLGPSLVGLPLDPGQGLADGGTWAEALGGHRQPALVLLSGPQVAWGMGAASAALLARHGVPLVGLGQWGGVWEGALRRQECLPWLGGLAADGGDGEWARAFALALRMRWAAVAQG